MSLLYVETPEARQHLEEMCEDKVIARVEWGLNHDVPKGACAFGLEFESGERLMVMALPITAPGQFLARLCWRWVPSQRIWTKRMRAHFGRDRHRAGEAAADFLASQLEGEMIRGVRRPRLHLGLGERLDFELRSGQVMEVEALPVTDGPLAGQHTDCDVRVRRAPQRTLSLG